MAIATAESANDIVRDLVVHENDLVIATFGRAFWIMDNVSSLRQLNPSVTAADSYLFAPSPAYRLHPGYDQSTPVPTDEPLFTNPPEGAMFDYFLGKILVANSTGDL